MDKNIYKQTPNSLNIYLYYFAIRYLYNKLQWKSSWIHEGSAHKGFSGKIGLQGPKCAVIGSMLI